MRDIDAGLDTDAGRLTVAQHLDRWLSASVKPSVKVKTYEGYESIVRVRVAPRIGRRQLARLSALDVQSLYADPATAGMTNRSVHHTHRILHRAFVRAIRWGMLARNRCDGVTPPRPKRSEMKVLDRDQVSALLDATRHHPAHALYVVAITTGMRVGELLGLKWDDLDLDAARLSVRRALQRQNEAGLVFVAPKSARSRRVIVLSRRAADALRAHRDRQAFERRAAGDEWRDHDLVFCNATGGARPELAAADLLRGAEGGRAAASPLPRPAAHGGDALARRGHPPEGGQRDAGAFERRPHARHVLPPAASHAPASGGDGRDPERLIPAIAVNAAVIGDGRRDGRR